LNAGREILILILADLGTDHRCYKIASSLGRLGYRPSVLCDRPLTPLGRAWSGIPVRTLTAKSHYSGFLRAFAAYMLRVTPILLSTGSRTWIVEDGTPLFWTALIGRLRGARVIYDAREILLETPAIRGRPSRRLAWSLWLGAGEALSAAMFTVSPAFMRHYRGRHPGKPVFLLPNAPMSKGAGLAAKPSMAPRVRLIYAGALRAGSGLRQTLAAMASAPEYDLDIYGFGPEEPELRELARALGLADRVAFHGAVPFESLRGPIAESHIGLHLLEPSCLSFDLTLSNKIFDYLHGQAPVLLGPTSAHAEFLRQEPVGVRVASLSPEDILAGLGELREGYSGFAEACRSARARWSWEAFEPGLARALDGKAEEAV